MKNLIDYLNKYEIEKVKRLSFKKGEHIFLEGDKCQYLGVILSGKIKISSINNEGNEIIFNNLDKNDVFGNNLIFSDDPTFRGDVICLEDVILYLIAKVDLIYFLMHNENFLIQYLNTQSNFGKELNLRIKILSIKKSEDRVLFYLNFNHGIVNFKNITELSKTLFLSRECLSRTITKLINEGKIKRDKNKLVSCD